MKNKKINIGKIALLTAAMAVTVPTAVVMSACGGDKKVVEHVAESAWQADTNNHWHGCTGNDDHKYDSSRHTWQVNNETYTCTVCDYTKTVEKAKDDHHYALRAAWNQLRNYQGGITVKSQESTVDDKGEVTVNSNSEFSYDPAAGIFYNRYESGDGSRVEKVVKDGDRYVDCTIAQSAETEEDAGYAYDLVDDQYLTGKVLPNAGISSNLMTFCGINMQPWIDNLRYDKFAEKFWEIAGEKLDGELDEAKSSIDYTIDESVFLTATATAQTVKQDNQYAVLTMVFKVNYNVFESVSLQMDEITEVDGKTQTTTHIMSQTYAFDRDGYDEIDVGEIPADFETNHIPAAGDTYVCENVEFESDTDETTVASMLEMYQNSVLTFDDDSDNLTGSWNVSGKIVTITNVADGVMNIVSPGENGEEVEGTLNFTIEGNTLIIEMSIGPKTTAFVTLELSK